MFGCFFFLWNEDRCSVLCSGLIFLMDCPESFSCISLLFSHFKPAKAARWKQKVRRTCRPLSDQRCCSETSHHPPGPRPCTPQPSFAPSTPLKPSALTPAKARAQAQARTHLLPLLRQTQTQPGVNAHINASQSLRSAAVRRRLGRGHEGLFGAGRFTAGADGRRFTASTASEEAADW